MPVSQSGEPYPQGAHENSVIHQAVAAPHESIKTLQRTISAEETTLKARFGMAPEAPLPRERHNARLKRRHGQLRAIHSKIAWQRHDFYHKRTVLLVSTFAFLGTEELDVKNMSRAPKAKPDPDRPGEFLPNGAAKAGLDRGKDPLALAHRRRVLV